VRAKQTYFRSIGTGRGSIAVVVFVGLMFATASGIQAQTLRGTAPKITVNAAVPGSEPTPVSSTSSQIRYSGTAVISKITVRTVCPSQKFDLSVIATGNFTGHGSPVSVILLNGMLAADFITSIPVFAAQNTPTLQYTCAPQFSDGTGTDNHTVTYTQVAQ
jgi:hypothetical protein